MNKPNYLDEIPSESLQQLLTSVAFEIPSPRPTNITALDTHLLTIQRGDVIEIQGPSSSGKTHVLYHLLVTCLTPPDHLGTRLGGWGKAAIILDSDGTFDVTRLRQLLVSRLSRLVDVPFPHSVIDSLVRVALQKVQVFSPISSTQVAATLMHLPEYHRSRLPDDEIGLLAIDSISSFYWPDRFMLEQMRSAPPTLGKPAHTFTSPFQHVLTALQKFRSSHAPVVVLTNSALHPLMNGVTPKPYPHPFADVSNSVHSHEPPRDVHPATISDARRIPIATHCIAVSRSAFTPLPVDVFLEREGSDNSLVIEKGKVEGTVRSARSGEFVLQIGERDIL